MKEDKSTEMSQKHHTEAIGPSKTSAGRDYCWKQAVSMNSCFRESTAKIQGARVNTETHMLVQQENYLFSNVQTPVVATSRPGKGAPPTFLQLLLYHLNKSKQLFGNWVYMNHKNPASWVLHWGETWYPTGCLIFLLKLLSSVLCWFYFISGKC